MAKINHFSKSDFRIGLTMYTTGIDSTVYLLKCRIVGKDTNNEVELWYLPYDVSRMLHGSSITPTSTSTEVLMSWFYPSLEDAKQARMEILKKERKQLGAELKEIKEKQKKQKLLRQATYELTE